MDGSVMMHVLEWGRIGATAVRLALTGFEQSIFAAFLGKSGYISDDIGMKFRNRLLEAIAAASVRAL